MVEKTDWRDKLDAAFVQLDLAENYAEDGAFLSAATCCDKAASKLREASAMHVAAIAKAEGRAPPTDPQP